MKGRDEITMRRESHSNAQIKKDQTVESERQNNVKDLFTNGNDSLFLHDVTHVEWSNGGYGGGGSGDWR